MSSSSASMICSEVLWCGAQCRSPQQESLTGSHERDQEPAGCVTVVDVTWAVPEVMVAKPHSSPI